MNFMPAADSHFFMYGHVDVYEIEYRFKYQNEYHASSRFASFYVWACGWCTRLNIDLNIEMNFMPATDSRFFLCIGVCMVYEIESRFEYRNEYHASSRFAIFYVWAYGCCMRLNVVLNIEMNFMPAVFEKKSEFTAA